MLRVSAKAINMFGARLRKEGSLGGCPRAWAFYYVESMRPEFMAPPLIEGIKFHKVCAALVLTGRMPEPQTIQPGVVLTEYDCLPESTLGKMARHAIVHLPRSEVGDLKFRTWEVEQEWVYEWTTRNGIVCEIDLRPDVCANDILIHLIDWKSTGHKRNTLTTLKDDVQANLYAVGLMRRWEKEALLARWVYVLKSGTHAAWPIDCMFHKSVAEAWLHDNIDATIELIATLRDATGLRALDLPGDIHACDGVGLRCDYSGPCLGPVGPLPSRLIQLDEIVRYKEAS